MRRQVFGLSLVVCLLGFEGPAAADFYGGYYGQRSAPPIISLELDAKASLDSSMRVAAREGRLEDVLRYLKSGADVNSRSDAGMTALMYASRNCSAKVVESLLEARADRDIRDDRGRTALMLAASDGCAPVVHALLKSHADSRLRDREGRTALDYARRAASTEVGGPGEEIIRDLRRLWGDR